MIKLGRINILTKVSLLSSHVALPRERHLQAAVHVMAHVGQRYNSRLENDPLYPETDHSVFKQCDWSEFYKDAIPMNTPQPQRRLISACLQIVIMHETKCLTDQEVAS